MILDVLYPNAGSSLEEPWYSFPGNSSYSNIDAPADADRDEIKLAIAKCLAGNLCMHYDFAKIGRPRKVQQCAVYELLNFYRVAKDPCTTSAELYRLKCIITSYCFCGENCGCSDTFTKPNPVPEVSRQSFVSPGSGSGSGSGSAPECQGSLTVSANIGVAEDSTLVANITFPYAGNWSFTLRIVRYSEDAAQVVYNQTTSVTNSDTMTVPNIPAKESGYTYTIYESFVIGDCEYCFSISNSDGMKEQEEREITIPLRNGDCPSYVANSGSGSDSQYSEFV